MMVNPDIYLDDVVKVDECTYEDLIKERKKLCSSISRLEKIVFEDKERKDPSWMTIPTPDVRYSVSLDYLEALCQVMQKRFLESKYSDQ